MAPGKTSDLLFNVAKLHYEENLSQEAIATMLNLSRATVSRTLKEARQRGIVQIRVVPPSNRLHALEEKLCRHFGLKYAVVVETASLDDTRNRLGRAAAEFVLTHLHREAVLGVSDGKTAAAVAEHLKIAESLKVHVVPLVGGVGAQEAQTHPSGVARTAANNLDGFTYLLNAPAMAQDAAAKDIFLNDPIVKKAYTFVRKVEVAIVGVGAINANTALVRHGVLSVEEIDEARELGAVGAICARFYDQNGKSLPSSFEDRTISVTLHGLQKIPVSLAVASGMDKAEAILAALKGRLINGLGTDRETAETLIRSDKHVAL